MTMSNRPPEIRIEDEGGAASGIRWFLTALAWFLLIPPWGFIVYFYSVKIVSEYERGVIFRMGRLVGAKGPGLFLILPIVDRMVKIDLRIVTMDVPSQECITRDNVTVKVNAVIYFRVVTPEDAVVKVLDHFRATSQIAQTTLRSVIGQSDLDELLSEREHINERLQKIIDEQTEPWGVKVSTVEVKDVELPQTHAARDRPPGGGRARTAREGDQRRRRAAGIGAAGRGRAHHVGVAGDAAAALPADAVGGGDGEEQHDRVPGAGRPDQPADDEHAARRRLRRRAAAACPRRSERRLDAGDRGRHASTGDRAAEERTARGAAIARRHRELGCQVDGRWSM